uniref:Uncharacterized protein n=1 Tax=Fagus sylvatica TaxID=28930 RepID=A0A2N9GIA7_FAGSY
MEDSEQSLEPTLDSFSYLDDWAWHQTLSPTWMSWVRLREIGGCRLQALGGQVS